MVIRMEQKDHITPFEELTAIIEALRSENGCPWDKVQTHESLCPCMMEEAAELLGAVRIYQETGNAENLQEELGDILLQVVLHSVIAQEEGLFTIDDVVKGISSKMIRRHPHVFGEAHFEDRQQLQQSWEEIKKQEKEGKEWITSPLTEIPKELPSLTRAVKVAKKMDKLQQYQDPQTGESPIPDSLELAADMVKQAQRLQTQLAQTDSDAKPRKEELSEAMTSLLRQICRLSYREGIQPEQLLYDDIENIIAESEKKLDIIGFF